MRKVKLAFMCLLLICAGKIANAQVGLGLKIGPTINTMWGSGTETDGDEKKTAKLGFLFGASVNVNISDRLAFQPELLIYQRGVGFKEDGYKLRLNLTYIELPLLLQIKFGENKVKGFVNVGPSIGLMTGGRAVYIDPDGDKESESVTSFYDGDENRLDIGLNLGGGVAIELGPGDLTIEPRFILGLIDTDSYPDFSVRNFSTGIHLGYVYYFGK